MTPETPLDKQIAIAVVESLKTIPDLFGCLPEKVTVTNSLTDPSLGGLRYHVEFDIPMPITFAGG